MSTNITTQNPTANHFVYIAGLETPLGDRSRPHACAYYYSGKAEDVAARFHEPMSGPGAKILAAAARQGIAIAIVLIIGCDSEQTATALEALIKNRGGIRRQLPVLTRLARKVVTMEDLERRGRKPVKDVMQARQARLNKRAARRRELLAQEREVTPFDQVEADGHAPAAITYQPPIYTPGVPAYLWADQPLAEDLAF